MSRRDVYRAMRNPITPRYLELRDHITASILAALAEGPRVPFTVTCLARVHALRVEGVVEI